MIEKLTKYLGRWRSSKGILILTPDCKYTNSTCGSHGQFPILSTDHGNIQITVDAVLLNAPTQCSPLGVRDCYYQYDKQTQYLTLNCSNGLVGNYYRN